MKKGKIPKSTVERLPLYHRYLNMFYEQGKLRVSSTELSEVLKINSATIRRDFSYFGELGKRGYGYDVEHILNFFTKELDIATFKPVALVGAGHLGQALMAYAPQKNTNTKVVVAFDQDPDLINTELFDIPVFGMNQLKEKLTEYKIDIVIISVPAKASQEVTDALSETSIKGILNFTPVRLDVPKDIRVQNVDLSHEMQTLIYIVDNE